MREESNPHWSGVIGPHSGDRSSRPNGENLPATIEQRDRFVDRVSRTHDQRVQATRSANQNLA